ncbi:MAG: S41 family peptidase [Granulosicoccus sp.]
MLLKMPRVLMTLSVVTTALLTSCGGSSGDPESAPNDPPLEPDQQVQYVTPADITTCSVDDIKGRVGFDMLDYYIYYDQVPPLNPVGFETPEELIRALRVNPDIYSNVQDEQEQGALFEDGVTSGYGFRFSPASDGVVRFREILLGSPADDAGLLRGDELIRLNGRLISDYTNDEIRTVLSEGQPPITMQVRTTDSATRDVALEQGTYRWRTARSFVFRSEGQPTVGLIEVRTFLETTSSEIDAGIEFLLESDIDELIVDLRYNPGGRTRVAERLAAQIAGPSVDGLPFLTRTWNDKYSENNSTSTLEAAEPTLTLPRVFVLLTDRSASASEAMVNGLEPYMNVIVIGGATEGKIFTSNARNYCGKSINAMRSERTNSVGVSVLGGIQPDCTVADDWTMQAWSPSDPMILAARDYMRTGACTTPMLAAKDLSPRRRSSDDPVFNGMSDLTDTPLDLVD